MLYSKDTIYKLKILPVILHRKTCLCICLKQDPIAWHLLDPKVILYAVSRAYNYKTIYMILNMHQNNKFLNYKSHTYSSNSGNCEYNSPKAVREETKIITTKTRDFDVDSPAFIGFSEFCLSVRQICIYNPTITNLTTNYH